VTLALVGINEELYSRGLSLEIARPLGERKAAALVAITFGLGHLQNYLLFGKPLDDTVFQVLTAAVYGFCLAGARLRMNTIWPLVLVHALDDWTQINSPGKAPDWWQLTTLVFFLAYGLRLTRTTRPT
jgi:membrane protease YdiL (CAAX protease family)